MARIFTEGFEAGDALFFNVGSPSGSNSTTARIGGRSHSIGNAGTAARSFTGVSEFYLRAAIRYTASVGGEARIVWRNSTTELGRIHRNNTTKLIEYSVGGSTVYTSGTSLLELDNFYVIELHVLISDAGGTIEAKVDGVSQGIYTGDTKPGAATTVDQIMFSNGASSGTSSYYVDDLAFNDTSGGVDNSWCGDAHIYGLVPNGNGDSSQLVGSDGNSTDNYLLVDEIPTNNDTDYVESATATNKDLYAITNIASLPSGSTVKRVIIETRSREITADANQIYLGVKGGTGAGAPSTESWSSALTVGTSYARYVAEFATNPATSAAWTEAEINAMQAGVKIV